MTEYFPTGTPSPTWGEMRRPRAATSYRSVSYATPVCHGQTEREKVAAKPPRASSKDENLLRFGSAGKRLVQGAAAIRGVNVSDYVRSRIVTLARQDVEEADTGVLRLSREAQIAFWQALQRPPAPTAAQRKLGALIRSVM